MRTGFGVGVSVVSAAVSTRVLTLRPSHVFVRLRHEEDVTEARSMQVLQQQQLVDLTTRILDVLDDVIEERLPVGDETRVTTGSENVQKQQYSLERADPD